MFVLKETFEINFVDVVSHNCKLTRLYMCLLFDSPHFVSQMVEYPIVDHRLHVKGVDDDLDLGRGVV